jgi:hypothetical protein
LRRNADDFDDIRRNRGLDDHRAGKLLPPENRGGLSESPRAE